MESRKLTGAQEQAALSIDSAVSLVASAGSGKTTVLVERYLKLLEKYDPGQILAVTFTKEAGEQLKGRIKAEAQARNLPEARIQNLEKACLIGTIHSFCYQILNEFGSHLAYPPIEQILDGLSWSDLFHHAYERWESNVAPERLSPYLRLWNLTELKQLARTLYHNHTYTDSEMKITSPVLEDDSNPVRLFSSLFQDLNESTYLSGKYTFHQLEALSLVLLDKVPSCRRELGNRFQAILVDEFQDTSPAQWLLLDRVLGGAYRKLFFVGDPKQSIYRFRFADIRVFSEATQIVSDNGGEALELTENFRSDSRLIEDINSVSEDLFKDSSFAFHAMISGRKQDPQLTDKADSGIHWVFIESEDRTQFQSMEVQAALDWIQEKLGSGCKPKDFALLFRSAERIPEFCSALKRLGIASHSRAGQRLFSSYTWRDFEAYIDALIDPLDDLALSGLLLSPWIGHTPKELGHWKVKLPDRSVFERFLHFADDRSLWLLNLIEKGASTLEIAVQALFQNARVEPSIENLAYGLERLASASTSLWDVGETLRRWRDEDVLGELENNWATEDSVSLLTVHAAKGLEFTHVLLLDPLKGSPRENPLVLVDRGLNIHLKHRSEEGDWVLPEPYQEARKQTQTEDEAESRRIFYVALTRAKETVWIALPRNKKLIPKNSWASFISEQRRDTGDNL